MTLLSRAIYWTFGLVAVLAVFATLFLNASLAISSDEVAAVGAGAVCVALLLGVRRWSTVWTHGAARVTETFMKVPRWQWLAIMLVAGIAARLLWVAMTGISLRSDGMTYYTLARGLFEHGAYGNQANGRAQWPPGLPFFYYGLFVLFGEHYWIPLVGNLLLYAITLFCVFATGAEMLGERAARLATLVVTIWPNFILSAGGASKELLLAALLAATIWFFVKSWRDATTAAVIGMSALSGLMLGMASLAQPSMLLFPVAMAVAIRAQCAQFRPLALRLAVIMLAMAAVIAPWSMRNYSVLKEFVVISTNGGDVFYRANNPLATGGYVQRGEKDLDALGLGEVERSRMGYELGKAWIRQNPDAFLALAINKQILFLGDDAIGAYESLKRATDSNTLAYVGAKAVSNAFWILIWLAILAGWYARKDVFANPRMAIMPLAVLYLFAIDSVFESGGRHHVPLIGVLAVLATIIVVPAGAREHVFQAADEGGHPVS